MFKGRIFHTYEWHILKINLAQYSRSTRYKIIIFRSKCLLTYIIVIAQHTCDVQLHQLLYLLHIVSRKYL